MAKKSLIIKDFTGSIGTLGEKRDKPGSARFSKNLDPFEDASYITLSRKTTKVSGSTVTSLVHWAVDGSPHDTNRYFYDLAGKIYRETSGGTWSSLRTVSGGAGEGFVIFDNYLYYALGVNLGRYGFLSGTPTFDDNFDSWGDVTDLRQTGGGTGATDYSTTTGINEGATHRQTFTPDHDPVEAITINIDVVGSGDWTVTLHDSLNNSLGTSTIVNASVSVGDQKFTLASIARIPLNDELHFHVTTTVADGGVDTNVATDLEGVSFTIEFAPMISATWHPMVTVEDKLIFGNGRYVGVYDQATYNPTKIVLDAGFSVRTMAKFEEFVVIAAIRGASVDDAEVSRLYFWDTIAPSFNFSSDVTIGVPNAIHNSKGQLIGVYGTRGDVYEGNDPFEKVVEEVPKLAKGKKVEVYPGAITDQNGRTLIGYAGNTDDGSGLEQGVYEWGRQSGELPQGLNLPFIISTGTTKATTVKIGMVKSFGNDLYIGWRDDSTFGVDKVAFGDNAATSSEWESLIFDAGSADKTFLPLTLTIDFESLASGESVTPKTKLDRASSFTNGTAASTTGDTRVEESLFTRAREIEIGFTLASSSNTFPKVTQVKLDYDDLADEISQ